MRHTFVLDENIAICATTLENDRQERDLTCSFLVNRIISSIHRIAWSIDVYGRWSEKVQWVREQRKAIEPSFITLLSQILIDADKCPFPDTGNPPALPDETMWTPKLLDDRDFIRLSAYYRCFLATTDTPLRQELAVLGIDTEHGFKTLAPDEALGSARDN